MGMSSVIFIFQAELVYHMRQKITRQNPAFAGIIRSFYIPKYSRFALPLRTAYQISVGSTKTSGISDQG